MNVRLQSKWLWVRIPLQSLNLQMSGLFWANIRANIERRFTQKRVRKGPSTKKLSDFLTDFVCWYPTPSPLLLTDSLDFSWSNVLIWRFCTFVPPPIVIDDSSWKNAAESFTVALTLTLGGYESAIASLILYLY